MGLKNISTLIVNPNKSALLILPTALSDNFQKLLQAATNCPNIVIAPSINRKNPGNQPVPKKNNFLGGYPQHPAGYHPRRHHNPLPLTINSEGLENHLQENRWPHDPNQGPDHKQRHHR
jgi:hypothetical protein